MTTRKRRFALGALAFVLLYLVTLAFGVPGIEKDLEGRAEEQLLVAGIDDVNASFDGRDGTLTGPSAQETAALAAVSDQWGMRSLEYESNGAEVVAPPTTEPTETSVVEATTTTTEATTTTAPATTTTAPATTTTTAATTTTTTAPPASFVDATADVDGQTITLTGVVASAAQQQALLASANAAFALQGSVVDQLAVQAQTPTPESDNAVAGLAAFIDASGPSLLNGSGHLVDRALTVEGQAFNQAAAGTLNAALAANAAQYGLTASGTVGPGPASPADLQPSLTALVGRSGVNFAPGSADLDDRSQVVLNSAAESIKQVPSAQVEITGYTDSDGDPDDNLLLSQQRADSVKAYLVGRGVTEANLTAVGRGEEDPLVPNDTPENKAKNRRIEFTVLGV